MTPVSSPILHSSRELSWAPWVVAFVVSLVSGILFYWWDNWWVNFDGGAYLYLGKAIAEGRGYVFPDGLVAGFRGPGYPALFAAVWSVAEVSAKTAIWASRGVLVAAAALVGFLAARITGRPVAGLFAGIAAVVPALVHESGGWYFVPDGLAALLMLASISTVLVGPEVGAGRGAIAGLIMGLAVLTKETALLYSPVVLVLIWDQSGKQGPSLLKAAGPFLAVTGAVVLAWVATTVGAGAGEEMPVPGEIAIPVLIGMIVVGGLMWVAAKHVPRVPAPPSTWSLGAVAGLALIIATALLLGVLTDLPVSDLVSGLGSTGEGLGFLLGWSWVPALLLMGAAVGFGPPLDRASRRLWLAGVLILAVAVGQAWYAGAARLSLRNAVGGSFALAILIGILVAQSTRTRGPAADPPWVRGLWPLLAAGFIVLAAWSTATIDQRPLPGAVQSDTPGIAEASAWLESVGDSSVTVTPSYASYLWFFGSDMPPARLLPVHLAEPASGQYQASDFCRVLWWAGRPSRCPQEPRVATALGSRRRVSAVFLGALEDVSGMLVVTGNLETESFHDGSPLLFLIEQFDLGEKVFATRREHLPHWAVVYRLFPDRINPDLPAIVEPGLTGMEGLASRIVEVDVERRRALVLQVLNP